MTSTYFALLGFEYAAFTWRSSSSQVAGLWCVRSTMSCVHHWAWTQCICKISSVKYLFMNTFESHFCLCIGTIHKDKIKFQHHLILQTTRVSLYKTVESLCAYLTIMSIHVSFNKRAKILAHVCKGVSFFVWLIGIDFQSIFSSRWQLYCYVHLIKIKFSATVS